MRAPEVRSLFELLSERMSASRAWFIELDSALGDGDLGLTMCAGFAAAADAVAQSAETAPGKLFVKAGMAIATSAPSTMGTLIATGFMKAGKALTAETLGSPEMAGFFTAFFDAMAARGKAARGDKTVLDSLGPACDALQDCAARGAPLPEALAAAARAARDGFERTRDMVGVHGRAAYYGEGSVGKCDPGAAVGLVLVQAFADCVTGQGAA